MRRLLERLSRLGKKKSFVDQVLDGYRKQRPVSDLAKRVFADETEESLNRRWALAVKAAKEKSR